MMQNPPVEVVQEAAEPAAVAEDAVVQRDRETTGMPGVTEYRGYPGYPGYPGARFPGGRVVGWFRGELESGRLGPGAVLRGERVLARELGVCRETVRQGLLRLRRGGFVVNEARRGWRIRTRAEFMAWEATRDASQRAAAAPSADDKPADQGPEDSPASEGGGNE